VIQSSPLERSADSLAALFGMSKSDGALRLGLLHWVLALPPEIDPAHAAQVLIGRQTRGESAPFSDAAQAMLAQLGLADRAGLAHFPRRRRRSRARLEPNESLPRQAGPLAPD
jgi:hypothetical protein